MDVLSVCPLLVAQNQERTQYRGFLAVKDELFQLSVCMPAPSRLRGTVIQCDWKLQNLLQGYEDILKKRLEQCSSLADFLMELKSLVERQLDHSARSLAPPPVQYYDTLLEQIEAVGWQQLVYVDAAFHELHLQALDDRGRPHILKVILAAKHPVNPPKCLTDLPSPFVPIWGPQRNSLLDIYSQFKTVLSKYQTLWDTLDELDSQTWVLEPENPTRGATSRRIALGTNASLQIEIDASHPQALPECRFLGADHVVNPLKANLNKNLDKWNESRSLYDNLQSLFEINFPSRETATKEELTVDCSICYSHRLDDKLPDQVCGDPRCEAQYHQVCLYEWLRALPNCRHSFNIVFGECPYCSGQITVKMPT